MKKILPLILFGVISISSYAKDEASDWQLASDEDGIQAYTMASKDTGYNKVRVITSIPSNIERIVSANVTAASLPLWMETVESAKVIKTNTWYDYVLHVTYSFPFPYSDRDSVTHSRLHKSENGEVIIEFNAIQSDVEVADGVIRMPMIEGKWIFNSESTTSTKVIYETHVVPGGSGPIWVINAFSLDVPVNTVRNLRSYAKNHKAVNINFEEIPSS